MSSSPPPSPTRTRNNMQQSPTEESQNSSGAYSMSYRDEPSQHDVFTAAEDITEHSNSQSAMTAPNSTADLNAFHDCDEYEYEHEYSELDDPDIPTIRLSNLGTAFEQDFQAVQNEFGRQLSTDDEDEDHNNSAHLDRERADSAASMEWKKGTSAGSNSNSNSQSKIHEVVLDGSSISPTASEEIEVEEGDLSNPPKPYRRQRLVSDDGIIAEFDLPADDPYHSNNRNYNSNSRNNSHNNSGRGNGNHNRLQTSASNDSSSLEVHAMDDAKIVAEAVEIDASCHSFSTAGGMHDLEMGDEEPLPYPGTMARRGSNLARAARSAIAAMTGGGSSSRSNGSHSRSPFARSSAVGRYRRAELLSATIIKDAPTQYVGLNLLRDDVVVYSINRDAAPAGDPSGSGVVEDDLTGTGRGDVETGEQAKATGGSLLRQCPFQAGDKILSINSKRTDHMDSQEAARTLREATGFITIVCQNPDGDPCLIETMITKANKNQRSGMGLKSTGSHDLRVSSINENGLFASSLLNVGDRILSINEVDVTEVDARVACDIIRNASDRVTVVARTAHTTGVVVAEVSNRGLQRESSQQVLTVVHEGDSDPNQRRREIEALDDNFQLTRQQREHLVMGLCIMLVIVAVMAGVFGTRSDNNNNNNN